MLERVLRAGRFDRRVIFEQPQLSTDSFGQAEYGAQAPDGGWTPVLECWARIEDEYGVEQKQSSREVSENWTVIQVRYRAGLLLDTTMRARDKVNGTIYDIRSVLTHVNEGRRLVEMNCLVVL